MTSVNKGLEGVSVAESTLSSIESEKGDLLYRGYPVESLAREAGYEEILYLLWEGHLPNQAELGAFKATMAEERALTDGVNTVIRELANQDERPMAVLRTIISMLSAYDQTNGGTDRATQLRQGRRITAKVPTIITAHNRLRNGETPIPPREDLNHSENFLYMLTGSPPTETEVFAFDTATNLHAVHGMNASTFVARIISSTLADMFGAITGAVSALDGSLHGGANQDVMEMLLEIEANGEDPVDHVREKMAHGERIPGFGSRAYAVKDPRGIVLQELLETLEETVSDETWSLYCSKIESYMQAEKDLAANLDFYSAPLYNRLSIPVDLYTPIFALSRMGGWVGHVLEQREDNRLIRPRATYVGEPRRDFVPINER